jgi:hypothetical protein
VAAAALVVSGRLVVLALVAVGLVLGGVAWWLRPVDGGAVTVDAAGDRVQTVTRGRLPVFASAPDVSDLYRFAADHGDWLAWMPCTCGCGGLGHGSNRACYIKGETPQQVTFTSHAAT